MSLSDAELSPGTTVLNPSCIVKEVDGEYQVWVNWRLVMSFRKEDEAFRRTAAATLARNGVASKTDIGQALDYHRNYVAELENRLEEDGLAGMVEMKRGPKGPHKVHPQMRRRARDLRRQGMGLQAIARQLQEEFGISISHTSVRGMVLDVTEDESEEIQGSLDHLESMALPLFAELEAPPKGETTVETATQEESSEETGFAPDDGEAAPATEVAADVGRGDAAAAPMEEETQVGEIQMLPIPVEQEGRVFSYAGAFLFYPPLAAMGLVEAFQKVYQSVVGRWCGLREVVLSLFFLWVMGFQSLEAFKGAVRRDVGALIGIRSAPTVKTLRRKLGELAHQGCGHRLVQELARRYVDRDIVQMGVLYVDGHMKPYYGRRSVGEVWSPQRRMPVPGLQQYFVNDIQGRPLFFLTAQPHRSLIQMLPKLVEEMRAIIGDKPFTMVFDRGGYSPRLFRALQEKGVHIITYRRKPFPPYPEEDFRPVVCEFQGEQREWQLYEGTVHLKEAGPLRNIAILRRRGGQTHILTTDWETDAARIASLMINRWGQENFFKYMLQHYALDSLMGYGVDDMEEGVLVPNPKRKELEKEIQQIKARMRNIKEQMGTLAAERANRKGLQPLRQEYRQLGETLAARKRERAGVPQQIPVGLNDSQRERLNLEKKTLADTTKVAAYNAEEWLLERLDRHYDDPRDIREVLRSLIRLKGRISLQGTILVVDLSPPETPKYRRALEGLCGELNQLHAPFPGTPYRVQFWIGGTPVHTIPFSSTGAMS